MNVFPSNADGSELLAVTESVKGTYRMDTTTLATKAQEKFTDNINGDLNTAHPKVLPNGDAINIVVGFGETADICVETLDFACVIMDFCRQSIKLECCWTVMTFHAPHLIADSVFLTTWDC